ncbi:MAG TPA: 4Fe-4S binding protein [Candidatus Bathyarchaeota archaeon]|nr:4Fe-4S binding protein [Candidatus Bathyarchaeota archaeon]
MKWISDKTRRVSYLRLAVQIIFLFLIFQIAIMGVGKFLIIVIIIGATLFLGRLFCGWVCPFGLYMDLITLLRRSLKIRYWSYSERLNRILHRIRYVILLIIASSALLIFLMNPVLPSQEGFDLIWYLHFYPPVRPYLILLSPLEPLIIPFVPPFGAIVEFHGMALSFPYVGEITALTYGTGFALPLAATFVILTVAASFKVRRFWCRFCPTGISIAVINRFKPFKWAPLLHLYKVEEKCTKCGICKRVCPTQVVEIYNESGKIDSSMCILCLRCVEMCPYEDGLRLELANKTLFKSRNWLEF